MIRLDGFQDFVKLHPRVMWETYTLHRAFRIFHFGETFWERKSEQFRFVREEMGLKLNM